MAAEGVRRRFVNNHEIARVTAKVRRRSNAAALVFVLASHRYKADWQNRLAFHQASTLSKKIELLLMGLADRDNHFPSVFELLQKRWRHVFGGAGHDI